VSTPLERLGEWFGEAVAAGLPEPEAMALATATPDGVPSVRIVLMKGIDDRGVRFFTNYESRKGRELEANPRAAATLYWQPLARAVRLEGTVEPLSPAESDAYYASRPVGSRLGAWASAQSTVIESREVLLARLADAEARYGDDPPRPGYWGGFRLVAEVVELWQGREDRLHDRERWVLSGGAWRSERLSP